MERQKLEESIQMLNESLPPIILQLLKSVEYESRNNQVVIEVVDSLINQYRNHINKNLKVTQIHILIVEFKLISILLEVTNTSSDFFENNEFGKLFNSITNALHLEQEYKNISLVFQSFINGISPFFDRKQIFELLMRANHGLVNGKPFNLKSYSHDIAPNELIEFQFQLIKQQLISFSKQKTNKPNYLLPFSHSGKILSGELNTENNFYINCFTLDTYFLNYLCLEERNNKALKNLSWVNSLKKSDLESFGEQMNIFNTQFENSRRIQQQNQTQINVILGYLLPSYLVGIPKNITLDNEIQSVYFPKANSSKLIDNPLRFVYWSSKRLADKGILSFLIEKKYFVDKEYKDFRIKLEAEFSQIDIIDIPHGNKKEKGNELFYSFFEQKRNFILLNIIKK